MQGDIVYQTKVNLIGNTVDKDFELWGKLGAKILRNTKCPVPNKIRFTMSGIQLKITRHAKKQKI